MSSSTREALGPPVLQEVEDGLYAYVQPDGSWWVNNTGLLVGPTGAVSVDTCATEARTRAYRAAVRTVTDRPVRTLVNTHHHGDHTHGNSLFRDATIVAHEATRTALLEAGIWRDPPFWTPFDVGNVTLEPPSLTYRDGVTLWVGDLRVEVTHVGARPTPPTTRWSGSRTGPCSTRATCCSPAGRPSCSWGRSPARSRPGAGRRPARRRRWSPGHGPVCGPEVVDEVLGYLRFVLDVAERGRAAGLTPLGGPARPTSAVRRVARRRARRGQPAPRLRGARRGAEGAPVDLARGARRHGDLQRRPAAHLPGLRRQVCVEVVVNAGLTAGGPRPTVGGR